MDCLVFYTCYETDDVVHADSPYPTDKDNMIGIGQQVLRGDGDFFGVIDKNGSTVQFMVEGDNKVRVEMPDPERGGSWARYFSANDLETELLGISVPFDSSTKRGMSFESW